MPANNGTANVVFSQSNSGAGPELDKDWNVNSLAFNGTPGVGILNYGSLGVSYPNRPTTTLTLQQGITEAESTAQVTVCPNIAVAQAQTWNIGSGGLVVFTLSGTGVVHKTGSGTLSIYNAQNPLTGGFNVTGGAVLVANGGSLGADGSPVTLNGGTLSFGNAPFVAPTAFSSNHPLTLGSGGGTITTNGGGNTATSSGANTLNGLISGPGSLTLAAASASSPANSIYTLSGANTYAGGTTLGGGVTLTISGNAQTLGDGNVTLQSGAALVLSSAANLAAGRTATLQPATASQYASALVLTDATMNPAALISSASTGGVVALGNLTYTTPLDFSKLGNGKLALGSAGTSVYSAAVLGAGSDGVYRLGGGTIGGALTINGAANVLTGSHAVAIGDYGVSQDGSVTTGSTATSVSLPLANDYSGGTALNSGTLLIGNDHSLGSGTVTFGNAYLQADGGGRTLANPLLFNVSGGALFTSGTYGMTFTGPVDLGGGTRLISGGTPVTFTNVISDGSVVLSGAITTFTAANTFSSLTVGTLLYVSSDASLGAAGATLTLGGTLAPLSSSLTLNRPVNVTGYSTINTNGGTVTINGAVTGNSNASLGKSGGGTLVLTNPGNTEAVTVNAGTLQVDNIVSGKTSNGVQVTVNAGATLAGTGLVGYTGVGKGHLAPGDNGPGTLTVNSALNLYNAAILDFDLGTQAADQVIVLGHYFDVDTSSGPIVVNFKDAGGLAAGQAYNLISWGTAQTEGVTASAFQLGSSPVGGTFAVTSGGSLQFTTAAYTPFQQWQSTYFGSINNAAAAPSANPAGDGISNLLKYALGLDPLHSATAGLPQVGQLPGYLTLTYSRPKAVTDIQYTPQFSDDLFTWSSTNVIQEVLADDGSTQTVRAKVASTGVNRRLLRLTVASQ